MEIRTTKGQGVSLKSTYAIPNLPLNNDLETKPILIKTTQARAALAELKGVALSMPNQNILISTLSLQEAKDSSAIENIITTNDELYQSDFIAQNFTSAAAKEVHRYASALRNGFTQVKKDGLLTNNLIKSIQAELEANDAGFRSQSGTALKNQQTGEIVYTPPQDLPQIELHMRNLENFIHDDDLCDWDTLVKMAVIHHQFESIHPFFDGNGRTGRILNILYLVKQGLLDTPILYLSRYINKNKSEYYRLLQAVRDNGAWEEWVLFVLEGIRITSYQTIKLIEDMKRLMLAYKNKIRTELPKIYSQDLLNNLFSHPYTKIEFLENELGVHRNTAYKYLEGLTAIGLLSKHKIGKQNFYINGELFELLHNVGAQPAGGKS